MEYDGAVEDRIDKFEMATLGNAVDFGDLSTAAYVTAAGASPTRAVVISGLTAAPATSHNVIQYFTISTGGDTIDFGDSITAAHSPACNTNGHGGLG